MWELTKTMTLEPAVATALSQRAHEQGQEFADHVADIVTTDILAEVRIRNASVAQRITAELKLKTTIVQTARELSEQTLDPHVILKTFQHVKATKALETYARAIGGGNVFARGNPIKARINRQFGALIRSAVGARPQLDEHGKRVTVQVTGELISSYTVLTR